MSAYLRHRLGGTQLPLELVDLLDALGDDGSLELRQLGLAENVDGHVEAPVRENSRVADLLLELEEQLATGRVHGRFKLILLIAVQLQALAELVSLDLDEVTNALVI